MRVFIKLLFFLFTSHSFANSLDLAFNWLNNQKPTKNVYNELKKFQGLPEDYIYNFTTNIHDTISKKAQDVIKQAVSTGSCKPSDQVLFPIANYKLHSNENIKKFENSAVNVETVYCLPKINSKVVFDTFLNDNYQKNAFPGIVEYTRNQDHICQKINIPFVGKSDFCFTNSTFSEGNNHFIHSYVIYNSKEATAPSYFREFFAGFINLPNGTLYYGNIYFRGVDLNRFTRAAAELTIKTNNSKALNDLLILSTEIQNSK